MTPNSFPSTSFKDELRFEGLILNAYLGGGMTSKLYQTIRERRGLAYSVYSLLATFCDFGINTVYAGCEEDSAAEVAELMYKELESLAMKSKISKFILNAFCSPQHFPSGRTFRI